MLRFIILDKRSATANDVPFAVNDSGTVEKAGYLKAHVHRGPSIQTGSQIKPLKRERLG